jgi:hypothetical protein
MEMDPANPLGRGLNRPIQFGLVAAIRSRQFCGMPQTKVLAGRWFLKEWGRGR